MRSWRLRTLTVVALTLLQSAAAAQPLAGRGRGARPGGPGGGGAEGAPPPVAPEELIRMFDQDGDGKIRREEAPPRMQQRWDQLDTSRDGFVTLEELKARDARVQDSGGATGRGQGGPGAGRSLPPESGRAGSLFQPGALFSVIIVGSGAPQYDPQRSGPSALVQYRGAYFLVDMGNGTQARLNQLGLNSRQIGALMLTHHHLDHDEEFGPLLMHTRMMGAEPEVVGPPGTQKLVDFTLELYAEDLAYRLARVGRSLKDFGRPSVREINGDERFNLDGLRVSTTRVNHPIYTVAYRFDADGQSIVISGDLSYTEGLIDLARGAAVLVIDSGGAIVRKGETPRTGRSGHDASGPGNQGGGQSPHGSFEDVVSMAQKSGAKRLVLTHIAPGEIDEEATVRSIKERYSCEVIIARDLFEIAPTGEPRQFGVAGPSPAIASPPGADSSGAATVPAKITGRARVYVRADATAGSHDGTSWATALASVQAGIDEADRLGGGEVWVVAGTYKPTSGTDRGATFQLRSGVAAYGGFRGTETELTQRDWQKHRTVLSGDIGQEGVATDNSYHVVTGAENALIDGFVVTGGYAMDAGGIDPGRPGGPGGPGFDGPPGGGPMPGGPMAGGLWGGQGGARRQGPPGDGPIHTSPDAILTGGNRGFGGGMLNFQCAPTIVNCSFEGNRAGKGGAMYNMTARSFPPRDDAQGEAPLVIDCRFVENHARGRGGAVANDLGAGPVLRQCTFLRNTCDEKGGAIYNDFGCSPILANCLFAENAAVTAAAVGNDGGSSPLVVHCTFTRNVAKEEGAALYQGSGPSNDPAVIGCILWGNRCENGPAEIFNWHDNDPQVTDSCVQGGCAGEGNFDRDPQFVDPDHGDYRPGDSSPCKNIGYTAATAAELPARPRRRMPREMPRPGSTASRVQAPRPGAAQTILRVQAGHVGQPQDGRSWSTAFSSLEAALAAADDRPTEIWVAAGVYKPTEAADRSASFRLSDGVEIYGGFSGRETDQSQRDWRTNPTVLSGDIGRPGDPADNAYHVVIGADRAVLDGLVIRDGNADGSTYDGKGGGMVNYRRGPQVGPMGAASGFSPILRNCALMHNHAREGGAVYNYDRGTPQFLNCRFVDNTADYGGAIVDRVGVKSVVSDCDFVDNASRWRGGAVYLDYGARPRLVKCSFKHNRTEGHGGAVATVSRASQLESTIALFEQCTFSGNTAKKRGGAIANSDHSELGLEACVFSDNRASTGGGLANAYRARAVLVDCRFSGNRSEQGEADVASDETSAVSRDRGQWPDPTDRATPQRMGPPR